ncbi:MAG: zf-HC2 domain-containing protein [Candidatus Eremiobacteraeota bacterium]|nr:zf-HC2 domain-containing protein [Candidatus Eremiobacteraeota bacterium]
MHCSYSEKRLDAYVEGSLAPRERARVAAHLPGCANCTSLLEELRVIDALLLSPRQLELAANFTFKVMAEVRPLAQPHVHRTAALPVLATYIVFAWASIGAFLWWGGPAAAAMLGMLGASAQHAGRTFGILAVSVGQLFGSQTADVTRTMGAILGGDVALAGVIVGLYLLRRSRRAATASISESR